MAGAQKTFHSSYSIAAAAVNGIWMLFSPFGNFLRRLQGSILEVGRGWAIFHAQQPYIH